VYNGTSHNIAEKKIEACAPPPSAHFGLFWRVFLGEKLVAPLIAAPKWRNAQIGRQRTEQKSLTTGYVCNCNAKEITILFCTQIGKSPNTSYAKCRMGLRERKWKWRGTALVPALFSCLKLLEGRR
jgi:hypothetical protein